MMSSVRSRTVCSGRTSSAEENTRTKLRDVGCLGATVCAAWEGGANLPFQTTVDPATTQRTSRREKRTARKHWPQGRCKNMPRLRYEKHQLPSMPHQINSYTSRPFVESAAADNNGY